MIVYRVTNSSAISSVSYNEDDKELFIEFKDGRVITHIDVPKKIFEELLEAKSTGLYYNTKIRNSFSTRG